MSLRFPHVCLVAPNAYPLLSGDPTIQLIGGAELQMVLVARLLAAKGHPVSMICLDFGQEDETIVDCVKVFRAHRPYAGIPILRYLWPRLTSVWNCLKRADADIYYQQTASHLTGVMAAFCKWYGKKSVFASASNPDLVPNTPRIQYARDRWIYAYGLRHVDQIFVQNDEQARLCRNHHAREPILVPNCYALPDRRPAYSEKRYILWVSTIRQIKRPELFLDLAQALPNHQFRMIGGPDDDDAALFEDIKSRANRMANVEFLGFVPFAESEAHFDAATLFINTSESEGVPNSFLQAWARGVPTISFIDAGAHLEGQPVGFRVKSLGEMEQLIATLSSNVTMRLAEGRRCADYVEKVHSPKKVVALYESLFMKLAGSDSFAAEQSSVPNSGSASGNAPR
jgi:glycosyltransferase involved in cell wall biosynthesis